MARGLARSCRGIGYLLLGISVATARAQGLFPLRIPDVYTYYNIHMFLTPRGCGGFSDGKDVTRGASIRFLCDRRTARTVTAPRYCSLVNQPVFLRMREGEKNGLAKLARFLKSLGMCNGILAPINCMRA